MAHQEMEVLGATAADLSADMAQHRKMYRNFLKLLGYTSIVCFAILVVVFFAVY
ncbi:MAG: hypothetical protein AB7O56_03375 [Bauldia sp.]